MDLSLYACDKELDHLKKNIRNLDTLQSNKNMLLDFAEDCLTGWKVPKVSKSRTITLLRRLSLLTAELGKNKEWLCYEERDTKRMLM